MLQLVWVEHNQTCYITARDLDADAAQQIKDFVQQQQHQQQTVQNGDGQDAAVTGPSMLPADGQDQPVNSRRCRIIPYGVTPALQQWMSQQQVCITSLHFA